MWWWRWIVFIVGDRDVDRDYDVGRNGDSTSDGDGDDVGDDLEVDIPVCSVRIQHCHILIWGC